MFPALDFRQRCSALAAFVLPALTLALPSGYAYGIVLLTLCALATAPHWLRQPMASTSARWLLLVFAVMGAVWLYGGDLSKGWSVLNKPSRYLLAVLCIPFVFAFPPRGRYLLLGIAVGAAAGGFRALYDVHVLGFDRAWIDSATRSSGAIQYGNLSGLFGLMCWLQWVVGMERCRWQQRLLMAACAVLGLLGSLLSQTRGGWLALALCMLPLSWLLVRHLWGRRVLVGGAGLLALVLLLSWYQAPQLEQRWEQAQSEVSGYVDNGNARTSVGQRLDHWQLAWNMGLDRPLGGWGEVGYQQEKQRRVAAGLAHPIVLEFGHAHNEWLDMFAKRGLFGIGGLLLFYGIPLALFWPTQARVRLPDGEIDRDALCLRLVGVLFPMSYLGFGLTQVFLAHYNGLMVYMFMVTLTLAALKGLPCTSTRYPVSVQKNQPSASSQH